MPVLQSSRGPTARDAATRHDSLLGRRAGRVCFLKRASDAGTAHALVREASIYRLLRRDPVVAEIVPTVLHADHGQLALEAIEGVDLQIRHVAGRDLDPPLVRAIGQAVAAVHASRTIMRDAPPAAGSVLREAYAPNLVLLRGLSGAGIELLRMLQRSTELCASLKRVDDLEQTCLVHGDLRWENIMVEEATGTAPRIRLVDWEFAGRGDARDDVGAFIAACIGAWIDSIPAIPGVAADELADNARWPVRAMKRTIREFTDFYTACRWMRPAEAAGFIDRAFASAAVRLVHRAFESTNDRETVGLGAVLHLQVALNILRDSGNAASEFRDVRSGGVLERPR